MKLVSGSFFQRIGQAQPHPSNPRGYMGTWDPQLCLTGLNLCFKDIVGSPLAIHRLRLYLSTARGTGSIPDRGTRIPQAPKCSQKVNTFFKKTF